MKTLVIVLLILTVLMLTPLGIDGGFNDKSLILGIRVGFLNIRLFPKKEKRSEPKISKKRKKPKPSKKDSEGAPKKPLSKKELIALIKIGLKALGRLKRKLRVDYLRIRYTFASDDPFNTAIGFGASAAVLSSLIPLVDSAFDIGERDIGTSFDFLSDKPVIDIWLTTTIQVWEIFYIAIAAGIDYLRFKMKQKRDLRKGKE
ncbi:MAG: hypothetical protein EOM51_05695 [Clostridia bacterium]|nr:hypothetical protein [Clostridia bacterium]